MTKLAVDLLGDWPSPWILVRLLDVVNSPWEPDEEGFVHRETGERLTVRIRPRPNPSLVDRLLAGVDPLAPSLDETHRTFLEGHRAVVTVRVAGEPGVDAACRLVRAVSGMIDGGASAVHVRESGLAHHADAFQGFAARLEQPGAEERLVDALVRRELLHPARTYGMGILGLPDVVVDVDVGPDRAADVLTRAAVALLGGPLDALRAGGRQWTIHAASEGIRLS